MNSPSPTLPFDILHSIMTLLADEAFAISVTNAHTGSTSPSRRRHPLLRSLQVCRSFYDLVMPILLSRIVIKAHTVGQRLYQLRELLLQSCDSSACRAGFVKSLMLDVGAIHLALSGISSASLTFFFEDIPSKATGLTSVYLFGSQQPFRATTELADQQFAQHIVQLCTKTSLKHLSIYGIASLPPSALYNPHLLSLSLFDVSIGSNRREENTSEGELDQPLDGSCLQQEWKLRRLVAHGTHTTETGMREFSQSTPGFDHVAFFAQALSAKPSLSVYALPLLPNLTSLSFVSPGDSIPNLVSPFSALEPEFLSQHLPDLSELSLHYAPSESMAIPTFLLKGWNSLQKLELSIKGEGEHALRDFDDGCRWASKLLRHSMNCFVDKPSTISIFLDLGPVWLTPTVFLTEYVSTRPCWEPLSQPSLVELAAQLNQVACSKTSIRFRVRLEYGLETLAMTIGGQPFTVQSVVEANRSNTLWLESLFVPGYEPFIVSVETQLVNKW